MSRAIASGPCPVLLTLSGALLLASCSAPSPQAGAAAPPPPAAAPGAVLPPPAAPKADEARPAPLPAPREELARLVRQLGDPSWEKREEASERLAAFGEPVLPTLQEALHSDDSEIRTRAATLIDLIRLGVTPELRARVGNLLAGFDGLGDDEKREVLDRLVREGGTAAMPALERILRVETDEALQEETLRQMETLDPAATGKALDRLARGPGARPWHVLALGRRLTWQGDLAAAIGLFESAAARRIEAPALRLAHAETLLDAGLPVRALPLLESLEAEGALPEDDNEGRARFQYRLAQALFAAGRFADALPRFETAARSRLPALEEWIAGSEDTASLAAQHVGDCLHRLGRPEEAEPRWTAILGPTARDPRSRILLAELLRRFGRADRATAIVRETLRDPAANEPLIRSTGAKLLAFAGRLDDALAAYSELKQDEGARPAYPAHVEALLRAAGRPEEALRIRQAEVRAHPEEIVRHLEAATAAERGELFDAAIDTYRKAMAELPQFPMPRQKLAELLARLGRHEEALALDPPAPLAVRCLEALGRVDAGIALGEKHKENDRPDEDLPGATRRKSQNLDLDGTLARLYRRKGLPAKGIECLTAGRKAFRDNQRTLDYHLELGRLREASGEMPEAILEYLTAWQHSGLRAMDIQEARRRARVLAAQAPDAARKALGLLRRQAQRPAEPADDRVSDRRDVADVLIEGELLALAGDFAAAAAAYERADTVLPRRPGTGCRAAEMLALAGKPDEARRRLERAAAERPDDPTAYYYLERLARAAGKASEADGFRARAAAGGALDKQACFDAAHHFMTCGELAWALAEWEKVAAAPGERFYLDTNAHEYIGLLKAERGEWPAAAASIRLTLLERDLRWTLQERDSEEGTLEEGGTPYAALIHVGTAREAEARGDREAAAREYAAARRLAPASADVREALGGVAADAAERAAHRTEAIRLWRDRIADAPRDPEPRYRLARFLLQTADGDEAARDEARRLAREACERWPGEARYEKLLKQAE